MERLFGEMARKVVLVLYVLCSSHEATQQSLGTSAISYMKAVFGKLEMPKGLRKSDRE